jgi:hypothetical protein
MVTRSSRFGRVRALEECRMRNCRIGRTQVGSGQDEVLQGRVAHRSRSCRYQACRCRSIQSSRHPCPQYHRPPSSSHAGTYLRAPSSQKKKHRSTTPVAHGLVREGTRHTRHNNVQRSADVNRHSGGSVGACGDASADNAHDSVQADGNAVAGPTVS